MSAIIYLHGFRSNGTGSKVDALRAEFGPGAVIAPDLPNDPHEVRRLIDSIMRTIKTHPVIFVGTSLGGFYANYFAQRHDCECFLINPATNPSEVLKNEVGSIINHKTGETSEWKTEYNERLKHMEIVGKHITEAKLINLFLARDDKVIPYETTLLDIPHTAYTSISDTGGHRYTDHFDHVISRIKLSLVK